MNPKLKKGLDIALTVLLVILLIFGVFLVIAAFTRNREDTNSLGSIGGYSFLYVLTDSMQPDIPVGSFLIIKKNNFDQAYEIGDVVTFTQREYDEDGNPVDILNTHEIVRITESGAYITQGTKEIDGVRMPEDSAEKLHGHIYGKKVVSIRGLGTVLQFLRSFWGFGIFIMLPLLGFFGYRVYVLIKVVVAIQKEKNPTVKQSDYERLLQEVEALKQKQQAANEDTPAAPPEE